MQLDHILTHLGEERSRYFNAVSPPIIQSSNFVFDSIQDMRDAITDEINQHVYTRGNNPTTAILRKKLAALEHAEDALVVSSGASAMAAAVLSQVKAGDHIVCVQKPYAWTYKLLTEFLLKFDISFDFVDATEIQQIADALKSNTSVLILESPNSLTFEIQDLAACAKLAKDHNITTVIDNSYATPLYQNPIDYGIDIVIHSGTKYINGHSDVVCGVICSSKVIIENIFKSEFMTLGLNISPSDAFLILRGLRTLPMRMERIVNTTAAVIDYLSDHDGVDRILFPFHDSFPQQTLAKKQMKACGGLFSIMLKTKDKDKIERFVDALDAFLIAVSWGGHESLKMPSLVFHDIPGREDSPIPYNLIRLSIGLESPEFLIANLEKAFKAIS